MERIACPYKKKNLVIRVEEMSKKLNYLAIKFLYQDGQTEIAALDVIQAGGGTTPMFRNYGAVWETSNAPNGTLLFRMIMMHMADRRMLVTETPIPADWKAGMIYDTGVKVTAIKWEFCPKCADNSW